MYAALIRAAERGHGLRITEFERRQLKAIQDELNGTFEAGTAPAVATTATASRSRLSSRVRTRPSCASAGWRTRITNCYVRNSSSTNYRLIALRSPVWRQRTGAEKLITLLKESLHFSTRTGATKPSDFARVIIDTSLQPKAVAFPIDAKLDTSNNRAFYH